MEKRRKMLKYLKLKEKHFFISFKKNQWTNKFDGKKVPSNIFKTII